MNDPSPLDQPTQEEPSARFLSTQNSSQSTRFTQWQRSIETLTIALSPLPLLTGVILIIHCWIYLAMEWDRGTWELQTSFSTQMLIKWGGNAYLYTFFDEPIRLITSGFIHAHIWHLLSNLFGFGF